MSNPHARTDGAERNEIVASWFDHDYVRRDGVLYEEWMAGYNHVARREITESEIPTDAHRYVPPIRY